MKLNNNLLKKCFFFLKNNFQKIETIFALKFCVDFLKTIINRVAFQIGSKKV